MMVVIGANMNAKDTNECSVASSKGTNETQMVQELVPKTLLIPELANKNTFCCFSKQQFVPVQDQVEKQGMGKIQTKKINTGHFSCISLTIRPWKKIREIKELQDIDDF